MRKTLLTSLACALVSTAVLGASPGFRDNGQRWYIQVSYTGERGPGGLHWVFETWGSKTACDDALAIGNPIVITLGQQAVRDAGGDITTMHWSCGSTTWK